MTLAQKENILHLRSQGQSYSQISRLLGVPVNTIKSLCHRANSTKATAQEKKDICKQCGAVLIQTPGHRQKTFCCTACRMQWWRHHPDAVNHKLNSYICCYCGKAFVSVGSRKRVYCSRDCYAKAVAAHE